MDPRIQTAQSPIRLTFGVTDSLGQIGDSFPQCEKPQPGQLGVSDQIEWGANFNCKSSGNLGTVCPGTYR